MDQSKSFKNLNSISKGMGEVSSSDSADRMSKWFLRFSEQTAGSPIYQFLSKEISSNQKILKLASRSGSSQPAPNLFLAAVNYILMKNPKDGLAEFYPNVGGSFSPSPAMLNAFSIFCEKFEVEIGKLLETRLVQTNEVQRCALLLPAVNMVSEKSGVEKISLVDVGASGGLNLLMDQVFIQYSDGSSAGPLNSTLRLECESKGLSLPDFKNGIQISSRIGIDLNPVDLLNADQREWNLALIWPDQFERIKRLQKALKLLSSNKILLRKGNANQILDEVVSEIPEDQLVCVMHSFTLNQFSKEEREKIETTLELISQKRNLWRISLEWIGTDFPELSIIHYESGQKRSNQKLAECHGHGEWIRWVNQVEEKNVGA